MSIKYNLNHIYVQPIGNEAVVIGQDETVEVVELTLFEKSLALTGDLKRLPVIRSINIQINPEVKIFGKLAAAGNNMLKAECLVFNKAFSEAELEAIWAAEEQYAPKHDLVWSNFMVFVYDQLAQASICAFTDANATWPFRGGIMAKNILTLSFDIELGVVAAGADLDADLVTAVVYVEIDWVPISTNEFKEYILESVYTED